MRQAPEHFGEQELDLVYVAKKLDEALRLEGIFNEAGLDYLVEPDLYKGGVLFPSQRIGAFFYVASEDHESACVVLTKNRYKPYDVEDP